MSPILVPLLLLLLFSTILIPITTTPTSIVFTTLGRSRYNFDIFSTPLPLSSPPSSLQLTDGISVNFNGFFLPDSSLLFVSERNSSFNLYILPPPSSSPLHRSTLQLLPFSPLLPSHPSFRDRPILFNDHLIYVSTHIPSSIPRQSWSSIFSTHLPTSTTLRLTPPDVADFSPSLSSSGLWTAVSSSGSHPWSGQVQDLFTDIYIFKTLDGSSRTLLLKHGGWPSWSSDDSTLFFHRYSSDGWWSIYRATLLFPSSSSSPPSVSSITRVTPPGFHAFTPAASPSDPSTIAIATRRSTSRYRHIELVHLHDGVAVSHHEVTRLISPNAHHFNPFISPDGSQLGYHRCRGRGDNGDPSLLLENINSPDPGSFSLFRIDGSFPSFSPSGDRIAYVGLPGLFVVNSDGSAPPVKVFDGNVFPSAWDWKRPGVIYTSHGQDFATENTRVDVISVALNDEDEDEEPPVIKKLTENGENNAFPSPSPDGESLVFRSGRSGHKNLYIMDSKLGENARLQRLTEGPWTDTMCNWSPDGDWIAFASDRDKPGNGSFAIYMIHPNGTGLRKVVQSGDGGRANHPWFSPDSKRLVFTSDYAGVSAEPVANPHHYQPYGEIFTVAIDGTDLRRVTHNSYEDGTPTWAPISLEPANVPENLGGGDKCGFDDCHWLNIDNHLLPSSSSVC